MIPFSRIVEKLEQCFARHDLAAAESLLLYWREEAVATGDMQGQTQIDNELLGLYRRMNEKDKGLAVAERLLPTLSNDNVGDATIMLNIATNYCHFGMPSKAAPLYARVEEVFLARLAPDDYRLAGLYNNMASMYTAEKDYGKAEQMYQRALDVISEIKPTMPEVAVTLVNLATSRYMQNPLDEVVDQRMCAAYDTLLLASIPYDGNYAFVLGKVIPIYEHLGYNAKTHALRELLRKTEEGF